MNVSLAYASSVAVTNSLLECKWSEWFRSVYTSYYEEDEHTKYISRLTGD